MRVTWRLLVAAAALAGWSVTGAVAQEAAPQTQVDSGQSSVQMPEVGENRRPDEAEQTGLMSGDKPFALSVDPTGEMTYNFDPETRELDSVTAKKGVVFTSEDMTLNADQLDYKARTSELVATGKRVVVRQGEMVLTCQLFRYFPETQKSEFTGNPILYNKTKDGNVQMVSGGRITVDMVDGRPQVKITAPDGNVRPGMQSGGRTAPDAVSRQVPPQDRARVVTTEGAPPPGSAETTPATPSQAPMIGIPSLNLGEKRE